MKHYAHIFTDVGREYAHTRGPFDTRAEARKIAEHVCLEPRNDGDPALFACVSIWEDHERAVAGEINFSPEWYAIPDGEIMYTWHKPGKFEFGDIEILEASTRETS